MQHPTDPPRTRLLARLPAAELVVALVAILPRVGPVLYRGGYGRSFDYDPSVYYAAAAALLHGRLPYRDFLLLHPPGIALAQAPFAALGQVIGDDHAFGLAQFCFALIGALNAALVVRIARNLGYGTPAAVGGGLFYAVWPGATAAEYAARLEPLGNLCLLGGLLAYTAAERDPARRRWSVLCGVGVGAAAGVKIWWVVPLLVLLAWHAAPARRPRLLPVAAGAGAAIVLVTGPFFAAAPGRMFRMVVLDQLERPERNSALHDRLTQLSGIAPLLRRLSLTSGAVQVAVIVLSLGLLLLACSAGRRAASGGLLAALALSATAVLLVTPSYFPYYDDFVAPGLALTVAAALRRRPATASVPSRPRIRGPRAAVAAAVAVLVVAAALADVRYFRSVRPYPAARLAHGVRGAHCVMSDSPMALVLLNVLDRDLRDGCRLWVDVTGETLDAYAPPAGHFARRPHNRRWQRALTGYLLAGDRATLFRPEYTGIGPALRARYARLPVAARSGGYTVRITGSDQSPR